MIKRWINIFLVLLLVTGLLAFGPGLHRLLSDRAALEAFLRKAGAWAPLGFLALNIAQVVLAPLPGAIIGMVGGYIFGFGLGFLLNTLGIFLGSLAVFLLARRFGKPLVDQFVGGKTLQLLEKASRGKGLWGLALIFLLPFLPDDALCFAAGLTPIPTRTFALLVIFCRTPGSFVATLTGAGLINLSLTGWIIVGIAGLILLYIGWRKSEILEAWATRFLDRIADLVRKFTAR